MDLLPQEFWGISHTPDNSKTTGICYNCSQLGALEQNVSVQDYQNLPKRTATMFMPYFKRGSVTGCELKQPDFTSEQYRMLDFEETSEFIGD